MSAASQTKVGGMKLGAEPKKVAILVGLLAVAGGMYFYNSQSGGVENVPVSQSHPAPAVVPPAASTSTARHTRTARRTNAGRDRGTLRIQHIDATNGDVDPTLRLDLLARLQSIQPLQSGRSLFEMGPEPSAVNQPIAPVKIVPRPVAAANAVHPAGPVQPAFSIPLKFYGFDKPKSGAGANRGFFLDGDKILVASEGELLKQRYLVVELTPRSAKLEDTQLKKGQTLPLVPEARNEY